METGSDWVIGISRYKVFNYKDVQTRKMPTGLCYIA